MLGGDIRSLGLVSSCDSEGSEKTKQPAREGGLFCDTEALATKQKTNSHTDGRLFVL